MEEQSGTEVKPEVVFLGKLLEKVVQGRLRVPRFQRPYVWRHSDITQLLDSVRKGYPIGSILIWETNAEVTSLDRVGPLEVGPRPEKSTVGYLLDGLQRISTLVGVLRYPKERPLQLEVNWQIFYDLKNRSFLHIVPGAPPKDHYFPVRALISTNDYLVENRRLHALPDAEKLVQEADNLADAFRNYTLPIVTIKDAELDTAVTVFARLNRRGRKMTADQLISALTYREGQPNLADDLDGLQAEFRHQGFGELDRVFYLRVVLAALDLDVYAKDWTDVMVKDDVRAKLPATFRQAEIGMKAAVRFLHEVGAVSDRLVPYGLQFVFLSEFFRRCPAPSPEVRSQLIRWFFVTSFTGFFGELNPARVKLALDEIRELADGKRVEFNEIDLDSPALPFPDRFDGRSARVRAFLLYLVSLKPRSLVSPHEELKVGELLSDIGTSALGYVIGKLPDPSPANRMFVPREHKVTTQTLTRLRQEHPLELLTSHGFPPNAEQLIQANDRPALLKARLDTLIEGERKYMADRGVKLPLERTGAVVADSDTSENEDTGD